MILAAEVNILESTDATPDRPATLRLKLVNDEGKYWQFDLTPALARTLCESLTRATDYAIYVTERPDPERILCDEAPGVH